MWPTLNRISEMSHCLFAYGTMHDNQPKMYVHVDWIVKVEA